MTLSVLANIDVDDLGRAEQFYCRALPLRVGRRLGPSIVELLGAPSAIYLIETPAGSRPSVGSNDTRNYARHWTPVHLDFVVPDLDAAVTRARDAGALLEGDVGTHVWGRIAKMADPFGHGICLIQFLNRGYDEIAS